MSLIIPVKPYKRPDSSKTVEEVFYPSIEILDFENVGDDAYCVLILGNGTLCFRVQIHGVFDRVSTLTKLLNALEVTKTRPCNPVRPKDKRSFKMANSDFNKTDLTEVKPGVGNLGHHREHTPESLAQHLDTHTTKPVLHSDDNDVKNAGDVVIVPASAEELSNQKGPTKHAR